MRGRWSGGDARLNIGRIPRGSVGELHALDRASITGRAVNLDAAVRLVHLQVERPVGIARDEHVRRRDTLAETHRVAAGNLAYAIDAVAELVDVGVVAFAAFDIVITRTGKNRVVARARENAVVAAEPVDALAEIGPLQRIGFVRAEDGARGDASRDGRPIPGGAVGEYYLPDLRVPAELALHGQNVARRADANDEVIPRSGEHDIVRAHVRTEADRIEVVRRVVDFVDRVRAVAAREDIGVVARSAVQAVVAGATVEHVVARAAGKHVVAAAAAKHVVASEALDHLALVTAL